MRCYRRVTARILSITLDPASSHDHHAAPRGDDGTRAVGGTLPARALYVSHCDRPMHVARV
jgi:hypothetical protein